MSRKLAWALLAGSTLILGTWAWAQQGGPSGQGPMGPQGQWGMGMGRGGMMGGPGYGWGGPGMMGGGPIYVPLNRRFTSNGERIYYTGNSATTGPIPRTGGPMWVFHTGVGCVACHGVHGHGGVPVMMGTAVPADIRYAVLTGKEHPPGEEKMDHPPYTDALIQRAITQGLDPGGDPLDWTMPRWQMADQDLADLLAYLKTLR
jgi:cytochrome c oxidase subunit II